MVLGGVAGLGLPETLGKSLPQSLEEAEDFKVDCSLQSCCPPKTRAEGKEFTNSEEERNLEQVEKALLEQHEEIGRESSSSTAHSRQPTSSL